MTKVTEVTDDNFQHFLDDSLAVPVVLYYWAPWCGPCKQLGPIITELAYRYEGRIQFGKINADENPKTVTANSVSGLPTIHIYDGVELVHSSAGAMSRLKLIKILDEIAG